MVLGSRFYDSVKAVVINANYWKQSRLEIFQRVYLMNTNNVNVLRCLSGYEIEQSSRESFEKTFTLIVVFCLGCLITRMVEGWSLNRKFPLH